MTMTQAQSGEIWDLIKDLKVAMMITNDNGILRSRPMHLVQDEFEGTLWFFTKSSGDKTDEIAADSDINLSFADTNAQTYVSLSGTAKLIRDQKLIEKFWNPFIAAWFPEGKESDNVALIEVRITQAESWNAEESKMVQLYEIAKANVTDTKPDMGENRKYG